MTKRTERRMITVELVCWLVLTLGFLSAVPAAYRAVAAGPVEETPTVWTWTETEVAP